MIPRYQRPAMAALWTDDAKWRRWLDVEIAVVQAWADEGVVPREDAEKIAANASFVTADIDRYQIKVHHDTHAFLQSVGDSLGPESRWVHHGLTTNDVWDTASALQIRDSATLLEEDLERLESVLARQTDRYRHAVCVGRTHGVHAEPTTFGLKLASWVDEVRRGRARLADAKAQVAVGKISGAVGTHTTVPPQIEEGVCARLGLGVEAISTQVVQRDRHAHFVSTLALIAASLERFATEIRHLQRTEVREVQEPFVEGQAGSSAMPHKRNPEKCERVCGLARTIRANAMTALENVALWHERDISHSSAERILIPDACQALDYILDLFTWVMDGLIVDEARMRTNLEGSFGLIYSQRVLLALTETGMGRDEAFRRVQTHALASWDEEADFRARLEGDEAIGAVLDGETLDGLFDPSAFLQHVDASLRRLTEHEIIMQVCSRLGKRGVFAESQTLQGDVRLDLVVPSSGGSVALELKGGSNADERAIRHADAIIHRKLATTVFAVCYPIQAPGSGLSANVLQWTTRRPGDTRAAGWSEGTAVQLADAVLEEVHATE